MSGDNQVRSLCDQYAISHIVHSYDLKHIWVIMEQSARRSTFENLREILANSRELLRGYKFSLISCEQARSDLPSRNWPLVIATSTVHYRSESKLIASVRSISFAFMYSNWSLTAPDCHHSSDRVGVIEALWSLTDVIDWYKAVGLWGSSSNSQVPKVSTTQNSQRLRMVYSEAKLMLLWNVYQRIIMFKMGRMSTCNEQEKVVRWTWWATKLWILCTLQCTRIIIHSVWKKNSNLWNSCDLIHTQCCDRTYGWSNLM